MNDKNNTYKINYAYIIEDDIIQNNFCSKENNKKNKKECSQPKVVVKKRKDIQKQIVKKVIGTRS